MKPLGREATDLIAAARRGEPKMTPTSRAASRAKILARVGATAAAAGIAAGATTAAATTAGAIGATAPVAATVGVSLVAKIGIAVVVVAGSITGVVAISRSAKAPDVVAASTATVAPKADVVAPSVPKEEPRPAEATATPTAEASPTPTASAVAPVKSSPIAASPSASVDPLTSENELIARAQQALASGQPGQALAALDEHARRFPTGALAYEREAARAVALCRAGRTSEGRAAAAPFVAHDPDSPIAQRIKSACGM